MKTIAICKFYFNNNFVGESPIPYFSTSHIRREIARHIGIMQYDSVTITNFELGTQVLESITVNFLESDLLSVRDEAALLTPTDQIRQNYKPKGAPDETGAPNITRPVSKDKL